ncbi:hypothetical protein Tco_1267982, partial [Tanacetum coccineum]
GTWKRDMESEDTLRRDFLYDFKVIDGGSVQYVPGLRRSLILLGTLEKEGYTVKMEMSIIKVDKCVWFKVKLNGAQRNRKAKVFQVGANFLITEVPVQDDAEGNVAKKKKMKEFMGANLGKLLKYNAWSTRWSAVRGSITRKRC